MNTRWSQPLWIPAFAGMTNEAGMSDPVIATSLVSQISYHESRIPYRVFNNPLTPFIKGEFDHWFHVNIVISQQINLLLLF